MVCETTTTAIKYLCSYGGKIAPRPIDGKLRYVGGLTRVFSVDRSLSFAATLFKLGEFCGQSVELRCQLPNGDLETLVSVKSEEELANLIEEYDRLCPGSKIRAILSPPPKLIKSASPPPPPSKSFYHRSSCGCQSPPIGYGASVVFGSASRKGHFSPPPYPIGIGLGLGRRRICS